MKPYDRSEVEVVVPCDQRVIAHRAQACALAEEEDHAVLFEDLSCLAQQSLGGPEVHRRDRSLKVLHESGVLSVALCVG